MKTIFVIAETKAKAQELLDKLKVLVLPRNGRVEFVPFGVGFETCGKGADLIFVSNHSIPSIDPDWWETRVMTRTFPGTVIINVEDSV